MLQPLGSVEDFNNNGGGPDKRFGSAKFGHPWIINLLKITILDPTGIAVINQTGNAGLAIGKHRVARLMCDNGLKALQKRRFKRTTDSHHQQPINPNLLDQDFVCEGPDRKWGADISYIWRTEGWLYLAIVLDLHSRRIVGWETSDRLKKDLATTALSRAIAIRLPQP